METEQNDEITKHKTQNKTMKPYKTQADRREVYLKLQKLVNEDKILGHCSFLCLEITGKRLMGNTIPIIGNPALYPCSLHIGTLLPELWEAYTHFKETGKYARKFYKTAKGSWAGGNEHNLRLALLKHAIKLTCEKQTSLNKKPKNLNHEHAKL